MDRSSVVDVCNRLHLAVDEQDWDALGAVLADGVAWPTFESPLRTREQVVELYRRLAAGARSQHLVGAHVVDLDGHGRVVCTAQSMTTWVFADGGRVTRGNTYGYRLTAVGNGDGPWRIDGRWARPVWADGEDPRDVAAIQQAWSDELQ